ncbi:MAG TPA: hypothetical protein DEQ34_07335 [Balneolaceae bacterium]|nr:hypothetical protein [Balneolaceae bacterium]|tara:strand:- start:155835 stop:156440 length:606 start_codon:yes stop_codon:yes gene_type:complete
MQILDDERDKLLDHEYDGIRELDNHMPVWWLWLFYFTIGFAVVYLLYYNVLGIGQNQHEEYAAEVAMAEQMYGSPSDDSGEATAAAVSWEFQTDAESIARGKEIYMSTGNLCFTCHGNNGEGLVGPNLTDGYWLHGCSAEELATSVTTGYPEKGMMPYGSGARISDDDLTDLISFIASIQGTEPANPKPVDEARASECSIK